MGAACCSDVGKASATDIATAGSAAKPQPPGTMAALPMGAPVPVAAEAAPPPAAEPPRGQGGNAGGGDAALQNLDQFVSQVGELPKFDKPGRRGGNCDDTASVSSQGTHISNVSDIVDSIQSKQQKQQAKGVVKDFVKAMVKGRRINVMTQNGAVKTCTVSLNRNLDALKLKVGTQSRNIKLKEIEDIHAGKDLEGVQTPLDDLCATLMLASQDCITFRLENMDDRDTFVMCLIMFSNNQK